MMNSHKCFRRLVLGAIAIGVSATAASAQCLTKELPYQGGTYATQVLVPANSEAWPISVSLVHYPTATRLTITGWSHLIPEGLPKASVHIAGVITQVLADDYGVDGRHFFAHRAANTGGETDGVMASRAMNYQIRNGELYRVGFWNRNAFDVVVEFILALEHCDRIIF